MRHREIQELAWVPPGFKWLSRLALEFEPPNIMDIKEEVFLLG